MENDPREMADLSGDPEHAGEMERLGSLMVQNLYGSDLQWMEDGELVGEPDREFEHRPNRSFTAQRGWR
jgi:hypothetical protein